MPPKNRKEEAKNICLLVILVLAFAAAASALSFTAEGVLGIACDLFLDANNGTILPLTNRYPCDISISSIVISTLSLTVPVLIVLIRVVFGVKNHVPNRCGVILQAVLLVIAVICLIVNTVTISLGLAKNCETFKNGIIGWPGQDCKSFILDKVLLEAAVCSGFGIILTVIAFIVFILFHCNVSKKKTTDDYIPLTGHDKSDQDD